MKLLALLGAMACVCMPAALAAQSTGSSVQFPTGWAPGQSPCVQQINGTCLPVSATTPLPTSASAARATSSAAAGTVAAANTFQPALSASSTRSGCLIQNTSTTSMRVFVGPIGGASDAAAFQIAAGGSFSCAAPGGLVLTDAISVASATAGSSYVVVNQ